MKNTNTDIYNLLSDAYQGSGGFLDGAYLERHQRESADKYGQRQKIAYYLNYLAPCVNAHVDPIFKKKPNREWSGQGSDAWKGFTEDVDFAATTLDAQMKRLAQGAKLFGINFLVMDSPEETAVSLAEMIDKRRYPYAFIVEPVRVKEIKADLFGRMSLFAYTEKDPKDDSKTNIRILTPQGWQLTTEHGTEIKRGVWNIGRVPVITLKARDTAPDEHFPASEFLSIAKTNLAIYNMSSWLSDILVNQTFSVLAYPAHKAEDLVIGTNNALAFDPDAHHRPEFITPPADPANILATQIDRLQKECYRMATVVNVTGVRAQASGEAKAWDFECTNQLLSGFADNIESAEKRLAALFTLWTNLSLEYTVNYPSDFTISDIATELANAEMAKGLSFGGSFDLEVFKRVLGSYLPELDADKFDSLVEDYEKEQEQETRDGQHGQTTNTEIVIGEAHGQD